MAITAVQQPGIPVAGQEIAVASQSKSGSQGTATSSSANTSVATPAAVLAVAVDTGVAAQNTSENSNNQPASPATDVAVRRDNNGRLYYSVSDAHSGQEILELPPKALRDVAQGIEDYVKETQSKASARVNVKV